MKIAVSGTHCIGKSTFITDFLTNWTNYKTPVETYRNFIKEKNYPHSKEGTEESQGEILNFLIEEAKQYTRKDNVIFDRCVLDNLAYSSWLFLNGKVSEKFLDQARLAVRREIQDFDIIFFLPITKFSEVDFKPDEMRDSDPVYREEIDNIFKTFVKSYQQQDGRIFPVDDSPPIIEIFGNRIERIKLTELYVAKDGNPYSENDSLINDIVAK
jgi:predicted ATPase